MNNYLDNKIMSSYEQLKHLLDIRKREKLRHRYFYCLMSHYNRYLNKNYNNTLPIWMWSRLCYIEWTFKSSSETFNSSNNLTLTGKSGGLQFYNLLKRHFSYISFSNISRKSSVNIEKVLRQTKIVAMKSFILLNRDEKIQTYHRYHLTILADNNKLALELY